MKSIEGKHVLFLAPAFFGYELKIAEKMKQLGAVVDLYDERSVTRPYERAMLKVAPRIFNSKTKKYYNNILEKNKKKNYDYIFVIKCEMLTVDIIQRLRELYPNAIFCLYLYDSLKNIRGILPKINEFDRVLSFDLNDTEQHNNIIFRPLFYIDSYKFEFKNECTYQYDVSFIGTIHSDRYAIIKKIKEVCNNTNLKYYFYCFLQSEYMFTYYKLTKKEFRNTVKENFTFNKMDSSEIAKIINQTRTVLDIQHPKQTGLTMRTIEMLGMNKKLITTNTDIKNYDFYNENNILIINRKNIVIPEGFLSTPYEKLSDEIYEKYSLEHWIYEVLGD